MVEGVESIGEAVTGGMAARAVEPMAGEAHGHRAVCLNCGTGLIGDYCHSCGQSGHIHRTLTAIGHDIAHSVFHFDGKMWRTLPLLAWRPGELTRRYVAGERARFVSPMALFLFSVFLMFAIFGALGGPLDLTPDTTAEERADARRDFEQERAEAVAEIRRLEAELAEAKAAGQPTTGIEVEMQAERRALATQQAIFSATMRAVEADEQRGQGQTKEAVAEPELNIMSETGWRPLDDAIARAEKNPSLLLYKLQSNAYKFSWALIPLSVPFLWLLFLHRRRYRQYKVYDHTVFVTYSIAFMSLGAILLTLLGALGVGTAITGLALTFIPPIHMYRQLRGAYQLSRWSAVWRAFLLLIFSFVAAGFFLTILLAMGVLG